LKKFTFLSKLNIALHWQIILAIFIGFLIGYFFPSVSVYVSWIGDLFLRGLRMIVVPLTFSAIVAAIANIGGIKNFKRLGLKTMSYYMITSLIAIITGQVLVNIFQPGVGISYDVLQNQKFDISKEQPDFINLILNIVPTNIFQSLGTGDMLGIIFFALLLGYFITKVEGKYTLLLGDVFNGFFEVMMKITSFIIRFAPIGIMAIIIKMVAENAENLQNIAIGLGKYSLVVIIGIAVHFFITLPLMIKFIGRVPFIPFFKGMRNALLMAFSTCSSGATLPVTMKCAKENIGISNKTTSFVFPLGATINMDGTALYECVAAIFIAQVLGVELTFYQQITITFTALLASIGSAAVPQAGLIMLAVVLSSVGLPLEGIVLILPPDRFLDMFRTATNVWSDSCCAAVVAKTEGEKLKI